MEVLGKFRPPRSCAILGRPVFKFLWADLEILAKQGASNLPTKQIPQRHEQITADPSIDSRRCRQLADESAYLKGIQWVLIHRLVQVVPGRGSGVNYLSTLPTEVVKRQSSRHQVPGCFFPAFFHHVSNLAIVVLRNCLLEW